MSEQDSRNRFRQLNTCVIIPTYNNAATIRSVIDGVSAYTDNIIVINDGCTDDTDAILGQIEGIKIVRHEINRGKGIALQTGFRAAVSFGYRYAITIDSDGQHFPEDLHTFLDKIEQNPDALIVGARNMDQESVPGKSSFGNKFSNFWFRFETGITLPDTQSGYRLYPVQKLKDFRWFTNKYEFEIEVLVRAAWHDIPVLSVPVSVYYAPRESRISHFRPFRDFSRVSVLNTVLVLITLLYIKPRNFLRLFQKKNLRNTLNTYLIKPQESDLNKVAALSFGVFMGIVPIWGFQLIVGITLCHLLKLNKALFVMAAHISIPPMIPLILFLSHYTGGIVLQRNTDMEFTRELTLQSFHNEMIQYIIGAVVFAMLAALLTGMLSFLVLKSFSSGKISKSTI